MAHRAGLGARLLRGLDRSLRRCGVPHDSRMVLMVSGGSDSIALLRLMAALRDAPFPLHVPGRRTASAAAKKPGHWSSLKLHVLHCDHRLRPRSETAAEAAFVASLARTLSVPFHLRNYAAAPPPPDKSSANTQQKGVSARMRQWRLAEAATLLSDLLSRDKGDARAWNGLRGDGDNNCDGDGDDRHVASAGKDCAEMPAHPVGGGGGPGVVVLAHHADDQSETMLLKMLRGCHLSQIRGMDAVTDIQLNVTPPFYRRLVEATTEEGAHSVAHSHVQEQKLVQQQPPTVRILRPLLDVGKDSLRELLLDQNSRNGLEHTLQSDTRGDQSGLTGCRGGETARAGTSARRGARAPQAPPWLEDRSNAVAKGMRNRVRLQLLPLLRELTREAAGGDHVATPCHARGATSDSSSPSSRHLPFGSGGGIDARLRDLALQSTEFRDLLAAGVVQLEATAVSGCGLRIDVLAECPDGPVRVDLLYRFLSTGNPVCDAHAGGTTLSPPQAIRYRQVKRIEAQLLRRHQARDNGTWTMPLGAGRFVTAKNGILTISTTK